MPRMNVKVVVGAVTAVAAAAAEITVVIVNRRIRDTR